MSSFSVSLRGALRLPWRARVSLQFLRFGRGGQQSTDDFRFGEWLRSLSGLFPDDSRFSHGALPTRRQHRAHATDLGGHLRTRRDA